MSEQVFQPVLALLAVGAAFTPAWIAYYRRHHYRHVILVLNILSLPTLGVSGMVALVWSAWPGMREKGEARP
jgi:hypothetical protein